MPKVRRKPNKPGSRVRKTRGRRSASGRGRRAIEVALAGLAHDIRTPLTGILALADLLASSDLPARERRWAESIKDTADHLARLTTIVVDAARADAAGLVLREEPFSARDLARSVAASFGARAETKGLKVDVTIASDFPARVMGDELRLRSALENLCDNAVKFTERGRIGFKASASRAARGRIRLTFEISDSGIGIVAADLKRLFKPFSQASEQVALRYGGAGLGLVFVKRIAEAMGGGLTVKSAPGRGSTFRLSVTVAEAAPRVRPRANGALRRLRILCAEDNPYGRMVLKAMLGELGHSVSFVGTGEAAVEEAARNKHDVVLMDVALAGIDGIEAARRIRALPPPAGRMPIVGISGRTEASDAEAAKAAGMNVYLRKPASPADLNDALKTVSGVRRA